jgi:N-acetylmuramoyl-L-alanine amidase
MKPIILLDSGHGGLISGVYQTAPAKMFTHKEDGTTAYEGVINRIVKKNVITFMDALGLKYIDICPTDLDLPLPVRTNVINTYCNQYGEDNCLLISLHSNAGAGRGFEIWTSPGDDGSDPYATRFYDLYTSRFPTIAMRSDKSDQDPDKESKFWILVQSKCPAILPEWLFFDNYQDWVYMKSNTNQVAYAKMIVEFINSL